MVAAALALIVANSPLAEGYFAALHAYAGPLSVSHWINDGLMAVFFLLVGLEIKREVLDGQLSTWPRRMLPGIAAAGGMIVPALVYVAINRNNAEALSGWAIPTATDIAFALGVLSLLGNRVPAALKVFLTALAIIDARRPSLAEEHQAAAQLLTRLMADDQALQRSLAERGADHVRMSEELATAVAALPTLAEATEAGVAAAHEIVTTQLAAAEELTKRVTTSQRVYEDAVRAVHERELRLRDDVTTPAAGVRAELEGLVVELNEGEPTFGTELEELVPAAEALEAQIDERVNRLRADAVEAHAYFLEDRLDAVGDLLLILGSE